MAPLAKSDRSIKTLMRDRSIKTLTAMLDRKNTDIAQLQRDLMDARQSNSELASNLARRTDQFRAVIKATNLILAVASGERIALDRD